MELLKNVAINKEVVSFQNASAFVSCDKERAEGQLHLRMSLQASNTYCRELLVERTNSAVRTALRCRALCGIAKYVKYAARVTLKLCVELLMRVVCCAFDCCRFVAF